MNSSLHAYTSLMLEHALAGIALYDAQDLRLRAANELYLTIITTYFKPSCQHEDVFQHSFTNWLPETKVSEHENIFRTVARTGVPYRGGIYVFRTQEGKLTHWTWSLKAIQNQEGHTIHLLQTVSEVPIEALRPQQAEPIQAAPEKTTRIIEAERRQLEVITAVENSVHEPLHAESIGTATLKALSASFHPLGVCLHTADPVQQAFHLLGVSVSTEHEHVFEGLQYVPYHSSMFLAQAHVQHEALFLEDLHAARATGVIAQDDPLVADGVQSALCVPLWFGDQCEGALIVVFAEHVLAHDPEVRALKGCGMHIAAALAHARLHAIVENERTRLRAILDQLPEGILITEGSSGVMSYANPSAEHLLGIPLANLVGTPLDRQLQAQAKTEQQEQSMPPWNFAIVRALSGETVSTQETLVKQPDGNTVVTLCSSAPLFSVQGTLTGAVLVFQDITAQKSLEQHKNDFLSMIHHELRTPITAIQGFAELLQMNASHQQQIAFARSQRALQQISEQSHYLTSLIEDMLDISRIEQAHFTVRQTPQDVLRLLTSVVETQATTTKRHHLKLLVQGVETSESLIGNIDAERFVQVFNNLISNAIKYSPTGGEIEIGLRPIVEPHKPHEVLIWVKDQGIGIAPEELTHIFKQFHRANTLDASITGLGIGLYLVKEIVTRHGGRVWVESDEGSGSTFYVLMPL